MCDRLAGPIVVVRLFHALDGISDSPAVTPGARIGLCEPVCPLKVYREIPRSGSVFADRVFGGAGIALHCAPLESSGRWRVTLPMRPDPLSHFWRVVAVVLCMKDGISRDGADTANELHANYDRS